MLKELYKHLEALKKICSKDPSLWNIVGYEIGWMTYPEYLNFLNRTSPIYHLKKFQTEIYFKYINPFLKNLRKGSKILDLGCGIGRFSIPLAKRGFQVVALDGCKSNLAILKALVKEKNIKIKLIHKMLHELTEFKNDEFDAILAIESICYTKHYKKVLDEMYRITKNKGIWIISVENFLPSLISSVDIKTTSQIHRVIQRKELEIPFSCYVKYFDKKFIVKLISRYCCVELVKTIFFTYDGIFEKFTSKQLEEKLEKVKDFEELGRAILIIGKVLKN